MTPTILESRTTLSSGDVNNQTDLTLVGCELADLSALAGAKSLRTLRLRGCIVGSLSGIEPLDLDVVEIVFSTVGDLTAVIDHPPRNLRIFGVPISREVRGRLQAPCLELSPREEADLSSRIWDANHQLVFGKLPNDAALLVRPGRMLDYVAHWASALVEADLTKPDVLLAGGYRDPKQLPPNARFRCDWISGTAAEARGWVSRAALGDHDRASLQTFIARFPDEIFYRDEQSALDRFEHDHGVRLPAWFCAQRRDVLAGVRPLVRPSVVQFSHVPALTGQYELDLLGSRPDRRELEVDTLHLVPIAERVDDQGMPSTLAISTTADERVFEYSVDNLLELARRKQLATRSLNPVFRSVAAMWEHVSMPIQPTPGR